MVFSWMKRARQVRTPVSSKSDAILSRMRGDTRAYRALATLLLLSQGLLFITTTGYDTAIQTVWQSALMLSLPAFSLLIVWQGIRRGFDSVLGKIALISLFPNLILDASLLLGALTGLMTFQIPTISYVVCCLFISLICLMISACGRRNGVAYGASAIRYVLLFLLLLALIGLLPDAKISRLAPVLGAGLWQTAISALEGMGSVWSVSLLFVLPAISLAKAEKQAYLLKPFRASWCYVLLFVLLCALWGLFYALIRPWQPTATLTMGERLNALFAFNPSVMLSEASLLLWLLGLPLGLSATLTVGEKLMHHCFDHLPRAFCLLPVLLPALILTLIFQENLLSALSPLMPYRFAVSLVSGILLLIASRQEVRS